MIKDNYIKIQIKGCRKLSIFEELGYDISGDYIIIKIEHLNKGSRELVDVICDFCNKEVKIYYKEYLRNISIGHKYSCCKKCGTLKAKDSNNLKYGVDYPMILKDIQNKTKKTNFKKYGFEYLQQSDYIKNKTKETILSKYGVDHVSKSEEIQLKTSKIALDKNYIKYLNENKSLFKCDLDKDHLFEIDNDNYYHRNKSNLKICTICNPIGESKSIKEKDLHNYIKSIYDGDIVQSYRDGLEIDIYLPELKLGFEFNGLYWHSELFKDKWYHIGKTNYFRNKDIRVIHIWEDDWSYRREIVISQINNWLGISNKIFARKCQVKEVKDSKISSEFLDRNHIQGSVRSNLKLGLYYENELVSLMTFDYFEGRKKMEDGGWNLSRFCNRLDTSVVGGASKLLKYFINNYQVKRIISYADRDWSSGQLYENLGFEKIIESNPDYKYIIDSKRVHKSKFRKSNLNTELTESKYMKKNQIQRIWDCGKIKFELKFILPVEKTMEY